MENGMSTPGVADTQFQPAGPAPVPLAQVGMVGDHVHMAHAGAHPAAYRQRWGFDLETGRLYALHANQVPMSNPVVIHKDEATGTYTAEIGDLAVGGAHMRAMASSYTDNPEMLADWSSVYEDHDGKRDMRLAREYWRVDELVYKCMRILVQLSNSRIMFESDNPEVSTLIQKWFEQAMPHSFREQWFLEYFRSGMVPALKALIPYVPREYRENKIPQTDDNGLVVASQQKTQELLARQNRRYQDYQEAWATLDKMGRQLQEGLVSEKAYQAQARLVIRRQYEWQQGMIAGAYTVLDPLQIEIKGPKEFGLLQQPFYKIGGELSTAVAKPTSQQFDMLSVLPVEIVDQIRNGASSVWLSPNICHITFADKQDYERYPTPMLRHAFRALKMKQKLLEADERTADSVRDRILKVTIGSDQHPVHNHEPIARLASIFANPARSMTIYWNHTLNIEWIEPPLDSYMDPAKYKVWDDQIRTCFGISRIFTGTSESAGAIGNSMMNFKALEEEITTAQSAFLEFLNREIMLLKQSLAISTDVSVKFVKLNLRDETEFIGVMQQMVQNGILDPQTALETLGYHFPTVLKRLEATKKLREKGLFVPVPSANNMGPDGSPLAKGLPTGGKPKKAPLADNNKNKKGKSQPKSKAAIRFMVPEPNAARLVVDADWIEEDARTQLAAAASIPIDWVMTRVEYQEKYNQTVAFVQPWPLLQSGEMFAAAREATQLSQKVADLYQAKAEAFKAEAKKAGGRGPYLTDKVRATLSEEALEEATRGHRVDDPNWNDRLAEAMDDIRKVEPGISDDQAKIMACVMLKRRYDKFVAEGQMQQAA